MPTYQDDISKVKDLRLKQAELNKQSGVLTGQSSTFGDNVMAKVRARMAESGMDKLSQDYGTATGQLLSAPAEMRARMSDVNPLVVDALTAKQRAQTLGQLASISEFQNLRDLNVS